MKFEEIINNLKNKIYSSVYFLTGEQPYYIDIISNAIEDTVLTEEEKGFNQAIVYGRDSNVKDIISMAKQYPMMSTYQVIVVKEAQDLNKIEELEAYIDKPQPSTILVLCYKYKKLDGRTAFYKKLKSKTAFFETPKIYDNQVPQWISERCLNVGYRISPTAALLLSNYLGTDLQKISNEIDKLTLVVPKRTLIDVEHIEKHVGISKDFNVYELQNAIGCKNIMKANQIVNYFADNEKAGPMPMITANLYMFFSKVMRYHFVADRSHMTLSKALGVNPFFIKDYAMAANNYPPKKISEIFMILEDFDMRSKGVNNNSSPQGELLKEMVFKIMH